MNHSHSSSMFFFFNDTATTEIYTLSLHDALPICIIRCIRRRPKGWLSIRRMMQIGRAHVELQSLTNLVCRLLLEKKKRQVKQPNTTKLPNNTTTPTTILQLY